MPGIVSDQAATLKPRRAAATYNVAKSALRRRLARTSQRRDCTPKSIALRGSEDVAIVHYVLKLPEQGYPPRLADVKEVANSLLVIRNQRPVGKSSVFKTIILIVNANFYMLVGGALTPVNVAGSRFSPPRPLLSENHAGEAAHSVWIVEVDGALHLVEVAEAPGCEAKASDAEERVKDLAVDLEPDLILAVVIVAVVDLRAAYILN
ncbi:hypothetical protein P153DRAFT_355988 [Dothidotthia symphoricarpi CBS 119687]|uniref:Uncharacterized protein n=1 Tax=Dothidotthia symphoricarpi CBS 119687 TaxID=1392245 RepID=A0A6A6AK28_9PLEO|nr:uncharacterized protein P153DRAFT_355988 [Dothidotthia symphoricarpi CBS 119687]KAF2131237.1 hypothetical protein P153DRAFT_355988 [Dothidotthia symphoricarpi CBS 119687]